MLEGLVGVALSLLGGKITKVVSKARASRAHEILSPLAAAVVGTAYAVIAGDDEGLRFAVENGAGYGAMAVMLHSVVYGAKKASKK